MDERFPVKVHFIRSRSEKRERGRGGLTIYAVYVLFATFEIE